MEQLETTVQEQVRTVGKTQCSACKRYFVGASIFEMHQVADKTARLGLRCLSDEEMLAKGLATEQRPVRMYRDGKPYTQVHPIWYSVAARESMQRAFGKEEIE